jgi:hypothetical protein
MNLLIFLCISALITFSSAADDDELVSVAIILRHGARTMNNPDYFNITNADWLAKGNGALTPVGKHMHFLAGKQLYHRYQSLLDHKYPTQNVHFVSSGLNRTIESMQAFGLGMFEGAGLSLNQIQSEKVEPPIKVDNIDNIRKELKLAALPNNQRTIPIHNRLDTKDYMYDPHSNCPGFEGLTKTNNNDIEKLEGKFKDFYAKIKADKYIPEYLKEKTWTTDLCYRLADNIQAVDGNGEELNFKFDENLKKNLFNCSLANSMQSFMVGWFRPKMVSHYLMRNVFDLFASVKNETNNSKKVGVYLMSDAHIMAIHKLFNWTLDKYVPYASVLAFELRVKDSDKKKYSVSVLYNGLEIKQLRDTELESFLSVINAHTFKNDEEFNEACFGGKKDEIYDKSFYLAISIATLGFLLVAWGVSWFCVLSSRKKVDIDKSSLEDFSLDPT